MYVGENVSYQTSVDVLTPVLQNPGFAISLPGPPQAMQHLSRRRTHAMPWQMSYHRTIGPELTRDPVLPCDRPSVLH